MKLDVAIAGDAPARAYLVVDSRGAPLGPACDDMHRAMLAAGRHAATGTVCAVVRTIDGATLAVFAADATRSEASKMKRRSEHSNTRRGCAASNDRRGDLSVSRSGCHHSWRVDRGEPRCQQCGALGYFNHAGRRVVENRCRDCGATATERRTWGERHRFYCARCVAGVDAERGAAS